MRIFLSARDKNNEDLILCADVERYNNKVRFQNNTPIYLVKERENLFVAVQKVGDVNHINEDSYFNFTPEFQAQIAYESSTGESLLRGSFWSNLKNIDGKLVLKSSSHYLYNSATEPLYYTGKYSHSLFNYPCLSQPQPVSREQKKDTSIDIHTSTINPLGSP